MNTTALLLSLVLSAPTPVTPPKPPPAPAPVEMVDPDQEPYDDEEGSGPVPCETPPKELAEITPTTLHYAEAWSRLMMPASVKLDVPSSEEWPLVRKAIVEIAIREEIMDPRESNYLMARLEDWEADMVNLRTRYETYKNCPKIADSYRFPDRQMVNGFISFNRAYRKNIEGLSHWHLDRQQMYVETLVEIDYLYNIWDSVRDARCEFYYVTVRRAALKKLQDMIGEEAYRTVDLPDYVPTWRFIPIE